MKSIKIFMIIILLTGLGACRKNVLDVEPTNLLTQDAVFSSVAGVDAVFAQLYADIPVEDYSFSNGSFGAFPGAGNQYTANWSDEAYDSNTYTMDAAVFDRLFQSLRNVNVVIQQLPNYATNFSSTQLATWQGEARFIRAYIYFGLVKYYGGVPLLTAPQAQPVSLPRAKEVEIWDLVKSDLDFAAANIPESYNTYGRATKWAALALESRAMLHAGSIGLFDNTNNLTTTGGINGVDAAHAQTYMQTAYDAANAVIKSNKFALFNKYLPDLQKNFQYLFYECKPGDTNPEAIFAKGYDYNSTTGDRTHSQDLMVLPMSIQSTSGYGNRLRTSMDLVEKFQNTDGTTTVFAVNQDYHFPSMSAAFQNKEARFGGTIVAPGTTFRVVRGTSTPAVITGQRGVIFNNTTYVASTYNQYFNTATRSFTTTTTPYPGSGNSSIDNIPFWLKKWTDPVTDYALINPFTSRTSWLDLRYGEVLLNFAEASFELGKGTAEATDALNLLHVRAGLKLLTTVDRATIRHERYVELAYENRVFWDYIRWRTLTTDFVNRQQFGLQIYYNIDTQDWVLRKVPGNTRNYLPRNYYADIPAQALATNPEFAKQPNRGHNPGY
ncbi:RagB/SusD family nutrient uptake outer membrane protein [Mucilaginibacter sp. PAMB04168]|uniref:RagB/SusD family nutrient uptake outer membrane protein n=1 Tax=Mucilaginibacter sp. PAMB04168 TaxID=3138567 RepID=UPI0031F689DE